MVELPAKIRTNAWPHLALWRNFLVLLALNEGLNGDSPAGADRAFESTCPDLCRILDL